MGGRKESEPKDTIKDGSRRKTSEERNSIPILPVTPFPVLYGRLNEEVAMITNKI